MKNKLFVLTTLLCCMLLCVFIASCDKECTHDNATFTETVAATCETDGERVYVCPDCSKTWTETVKALDHDFVKDEANSVAATCTSAGKTVEKCSRCTATRSRTELQLTHNYVKDVDDSREATCTSTGVTVEICSHCQDRKETFLPAVGHKWEGTDCSGKQCSVCEETLPAVSAHNYGIKSSSKATCTEDGVTVYECSVCKDTYTSIVPKTGHNFVVLSESGIYTPKEGTIDCTYTTSHTLKCTTCREEVTEQYEVSNRHAYVTVITREATCNQLGEKVSQCSVCGHIKENSQVTFSDENAHQWNNGEVSGSITTYTCKLCSHTKTSIVAAEDAKEVPVTKDSLASADDVMINNASIVLDERATDSLPADKELTLGVDVADKAEDIDPSLKNKLANDIYNITLFDGTDNITSFNGGKATVRIPYTLQSGEDVDAIVIWYVNGDKLENIVGTYSNGYVTFRTEHFSYYTVGKYTPEEMCAIYGHHNVTRTKDATCTENGYEITVCTRCGAGEEPTYTLATGHDFITEEGESKAASCTESGLNVRKCSKCDQKISETVPATGHDWQAGQATAATCQHAGSASYSCSRCDASYTITTPQRAHDFTIDKTNATCTTDGYTEYTCNSCGYSYQGDKISAFGHKWDIDVPTCGRGQICNVCGEQGAPATGDHQFKDGVCTVCGEGCDHHWEIVGDVPSSCVEAGYTLYKCSECRTEKRENYKPLGDHTFGTDGKCTVCGAPDESASEFYDVLLKSLAANKFTVTADEDFVIKIISDSSYSDASEQIVSVRKLEAYINITDDGDVLFSTELVADSAMSYGGKDPSVDTVEVYALFDGEYMYVRMRENDLRYTYSKYSYDEIPEPGTTIIEVMRDDSVIDYIEEIVSSNNGYLAELVGNIADTFFERKETADGYDVALDREAMLALNDDLLNLSVKQLTDKYFGDGAFDEFTGLVRKLTVELKAYQAIGELFNMAIKYNIDRESLFSLIEAMIVKFTGKEISIEDFLKGGDLVVKSIAQIVEENAELEEGEFAETLDQAVQMLGEDGSTVYALIAQAADIDSKMIYDIVGDIFRDGVTEIVLHTDKSGNVRSLGISLDDLTVADGMVQLNGSVEVRWNEGRDVVYDDDLDVPSDLFEYVRKQCEKTGSYSYAEPNIEEKSDRTERTYLWELKGGTLSLTLTQTEYYIYDVSEAPNTGRTERGEKRVGIYVFSDVENMSTDFGTDCGDWTYYRLSDSRGTFAEEYYTFVRVYDQSGQLVDETEQLRDRYDISHVSTTIYFNGAEGRFAYRSQHKDSVDEARSTTADDVKCNEFYYTYHVCEQCKEDIYVETNRKYHDYHETVELVVPGTTCENGVVWTRQCAECGNTEQETLNEHLIVSDVETYELPHGKLILQRDYCACGQCSRFYYRTEDGCEFGYSSEDYLSDGHRLETYRCAYQGCTAYFTMESWQENIDQCTHNSYNLYKFYRAPGQQIGDEEGYLEVSQWTEHQSGKSTSTRTEFTLEQDGYAGYREETSYEGCSHRGPYSVIVEIRYDRLGRLIYDYREQTGEDGYIDCRSWRYFSDDGCECEITYNYNGKEYTEIGYNHQYKSDWIFSTCTRPGYYIEQCAVCGQGYAELREAPHGHEFYDGSCVYCGLQAEQEASGVIVLEDWTQYEDRYMPYTVGVWNREGLGVELQLSLVYLNDDGEEEETDYFGEYHRVELDGYELFDYPFADRYYTITVDRDEVRAAVDGSKRFVGLRLTFIPVGGDSPQVTSITLVDTYYGDYWQAPDADFGFDAYCVPSDGKRCALA